MPYYLLYTRPPANARCRSLSANTSDQAGLPASPAHPKASLGKYCQGCAHAFRNAPFRGVTAAGPLPFRTGFPFKPVRNCIRRRELEPGKTYMQNGGKSIEKSMFSSMVSSIPILTHETSFYEITLPEKSLKQLLPCLDSNDVV